MVPPHRQFLGMAMPTTPATTGPATGGTNGQRPVLDSVMHSKSTMEFSKYLLSALVGPSLATDLRVYKEAIYRTRRLLVGNDVINHHELNTCVQPTFAC